MQVWEKVHFGRRDGRAAVRGRYRAQTEIKVGVFFTLAAILMLIANGLVSILTTIKQINKSFLIYMVF